MQGNGKSTWGYVIEGRPAPMLQAAVQSACRNGSMPASLPACEGGTCDWISRTADYLREGKCRAVVVFCDDAAPACCVANKVPGVRAVGVKTLAQARRALVSMGANFLAVEQQGLTYYECREFLQLCRESVSAECPEGVACVLERLDGHAHR